MIRIILTAAALVLAAAAPAAAHPVARTAEAVLAANREAAGNVPRAGAVVARYALSGQGMSGTATNEYDLVTGAFVDSYDLPPIGGASGFDGDVPWMRDYSGAFTPQQGGDRVVLAVNEAYRNANLWWRADRGGAEIKYLGRENLSGRAADHLAVTPEEGRRFDAWFDAETHHLAQIAEDQMFFHTRTFYDDYREEAGVMVPHEVTADGGTGEANYMHIAMQSFEIRKARPVSDYALPQTPPEGAVIEGADTVTLPFRLLNNHIYVDATVNGKGPYTLIVDTGGHTILSPRVVEEAGLVPVGAGAAAGAGEKIGTNGYARVKEIALGTLKMRDQTAITMEIYDPRIEGIAIDGMIGFEVFRRFAVEIDYGAKTLTFTNFDAFDPEDAGTPVPFVFYDHLPQVEGEIDGLEARLDIDTGSRSEITVTSPFVESAGFRARFSKGIEAITGWGVGGPTHAYVVRLPSLSLGDVEVDAAVASLSTAEAGSFSNPNYEGNIGSGLLKRFVATFDYSTATMYLKPLDPPPADAGTFDRSGLWINAEEGGYKVVYVADEGPAAEAGLEVGDVITRFRGKKARAEDLSDTRAALRTLPAGSKVEVTLRRGGETRETAIILRDLIQQQPSRAADPS